MLAKVGKVLVNRHPTVGKELPLALHSGQWGEKAERLLRDDSHPPAISEIIATPAVPRLRKSIHPGFSSQKRWRIPPE